MDWLWAYVNYDGTDPGRFFVFPDEVTDWRVDLRRDLGIEGPVVAFNWRTDEATVVERAFDLPRIEHLYDFDYLVLAPILANGMALLGETGKFVTVADKRFDRIEAQADAIRVRLVGAPGETVALSVYDAERRAMLAPVSVTIGPDGAATGASIARLRAS